MSDPVYETFLVKGLMREHLLRELRRAARDAGLNRHGVTIRSVSSSTRDTVEERADEFALQMREQPLVHGQLHGGAKIAALADIDVQSFLLKQEKTKPVVGSRGTRLITGQSPLRSEKAERNRREEIRRNIQGTSETKKGKTSIEQRALALPLNHANDKPIKLSKLIRDVKVKDARALLDYKDVDGITVLRIMTISIFAKYSRLLALRTSPARRSRRAERGYRQNQLKADMP